MSRSTLDREQLAKLVYQGPRPILATISGAHLYGFASPDSDLDLRGAFLRSAQEMLGLRPPPETIALQDKSAVDLDWVAHDVRKFARLMTQHNGYVLEQLFSPLVVVRSGWRRSAETCCRPRTTRWKLECGPWRCMRCSCRRAW